MMAVVQLYCMMQFLTRENHDENVILVIQNVSTTP